MVSSDLIEMSVGGRSLGIASGGQLQIGGGTADLTFGDFTNGYNINTGAGDAVVQEIDGQGVAWEIVSDGRVALGADR